MVPFGTFTPNLSTKMADPPSQKATGGQGARDSTRAPAGAASLSSGAVSGEQRKATLKKNHTLLRIFPHKRTGHKEKRAKCKSCLQFCSLLYAVIFCLK